ncbi:hypothetical protein EAX61_03550 [Dokdonia sinensis]|uniref:SH3 domain-containing protein n=1 Tax=Dokdonia sinensis TaxID=2479847 RepID=A0A3M0GEY5_9FLAO|nr:hypothetical protein [Dokdonia sinensis]RMB63475.1 hypothetical protein EAX61_03550 [Dokdonia sinensis]
MNTKFFLSAFLALTISSLSAQKSFFQTLDAHGPDAKYQVYGDLYKNDNGEPAAQASTTYHQVIERHSLGPLSAGITVTKVLDDGRTSLGNNYNGIAISAIKYVGFPNTRVLHHTGYNRGYVAFDNYIFFLKGLSDDLTDFSKISSIMILDGSAKAEKKEKKKGKFWKKLKEAALNERPSGEGSSPEYKQLMAKNPEQLVRDYLKSMKAKEDAYTMTAQDKSNLKKLYDAAKADDAKAKKINDAYWASPEGQAVLAARRRENGSSGGGSVTLRNNSNSTVYVGSSGSNNRGTKIAPGSTASWSCGRDAYLQQETIVGTTSSYKSTSNRVYSANSGCGRTVNIN